jgi:hypothetical protein
MISLATKGKPSRAPNPLASRHKLVRDRRKYAAPARRSRKNIPDLLNRLVTKPSCLIGEKTESTEFEIELIELKIKLSNETIEQFLSALAQPPSPLRK